MDEGDNDLNKLTTEEQFSEARKRKAANEFKGPEGSIDLDTGEVDLPPSVQIVKPLIDPRTGRRLSGRSFSIRTDLPSDPQGKEPLKFPRNQRPSKD